VLAARGRNLFFSSDTTKHLEEADVIFVRCAAAVGGAPVGGGYRAGPWVGHQSGPGAQSMQLQPAPSASAAAARLSVPGSPH
jgi:hypothetical protein